MFTVVLRWLGFLSLCKVQHYLARMYSILTFVFLTCFANLEWKSSASHIIFFPTSFHLFSNFLYFLCIKHCRYALVTLWYAAFTISYKTEKRRVTVCQIMQKIAITFNSCKNKQEKQHFVKYNKVENNVREVRKILTDI